MEEAIFNPAEMTNDPLEHIECRGVVCQSDGRRIGDLHVVQEGVFFLAHPTRLSFLSNPHNAIGAAGGVGGIALLVQPLMEVFHTFVSFVVAMALVGVVLLFVALANKRVEALKAEMNEWRAAFAGRPLDALVEDLEGSWWAKPEEMKSLRIAKDHMVVELRDGTTFRAEHLNSLQSALIAERAKSRGWSLVKPPTHPALIHCAEMMCTHPDGQNSKGDLVLTAEGAAFIPVRGRIALLVSLTFTVCITVIMITVAFMEDHHIWWVLAAGCLLTVVGMIVTVAWQDGVRKKRMMSPDGAREYAERVPGGWWFARDQIHGARLKNNALGLFSSPTLIWIQSQVGSKWVHEMEAWARIFLWDRFEVEESEG